MMLAGVAVNVISEFIFWLILIAIAWILVFLTRRAKLLKFYGVNESRRIVIYLSNLRIMSGGAIGIDGQRRSYQGSAAAFGEMMVANRFRALFNYFLPSLSDKPGVLNKLLISDVQVQLLHSPLNQGQIERSSSFITLGGPAYNAVSGFVETELHSQARLEFGQVNSYPPGETMTRTEVSAADSGDEVPSTFTTVSPWSSIPGSVSCLPRDEPDTQAEPRQTRPAILVEGVPPITDTTCGFVERIVDHEQKRCVFYTAGLSELGTVGAAHYLATEWASLHRKYGNDTSFVVMLRFEPTDYRCRAIVFERSDK
jgi:hypothetical protein